MKIVLIDKEERQKIGGLIVYSERFYNYFKKLGHEVFILRFSRQKPKQKYIFKLPYYLAEARSFIFLPTEKTLNIIRNHFKKIKPDIVYTSNGLSPLDFFLPSVCHQLKIPLAGIWHADFNYGLSSYQLFIKSIFLAYLPFCKQLDLLHVFSQKLADFYIDKGISKKKILILPNSVNDKIYKPGPSEFAKIHGIKTGILFLGRLTLQKNPEILIKSFLCLNPPIDTKLILMGMGDQEDYLRENYHDKRIIFTGAITDENRKLDVMRSCRIFVLPSRFEGMPLALLEAMSIGLSCIASDAGSNSELLQDAGIIISSTKLKQELPIALKICIDNPGLTEILGEKARKKILKEFSQKLIFGRLTKAFENTIAKYKVSGTTLTKPVQLDEAILKKLKSIWKDVKKFGSYLDSI